MFGLGYVQFNIAEGIFWILLAGTCLFLARVFRRTDYEKLATFSAAVLLLFGVSDFVELAIDENFLYPTHWLFLWKGLCLVAMTYAVVRYLILRVSKK